MGKKIKRSKKILRGREAIKMAWEFFRRQQSYAEDFDSKIGNSSKVFVATIEDAPQGIHDYFTDRYNIFIPVNPHYSYDELLTKLITRGDFGKLALFLCAMTSLTAVNKKGFKFPSLGLSCLSSHIKGDDSLGLLPEHPDGLLLARIRDSGSNNIEPIIESLNPAKVDISRITFDVDLTFPKEFILARFKESLDRWKEFYGTLYKDSFRGRFDKYNAYLSVYDLRVTGWSWERLARKFYKPDIERGDVSYAKRKVKRDYDRCKKLVEGGYRQIR